MKSPEHESGNAPNLNEQVELTGCLLDRIVTVNDVLDGPLAPRPEARNQAIDDIEATMVSRESDENGAYRLACPVGGCAVACNLTIRGLKFDEWSDQTCTLDNVLPERLRQ